MILLGWSQEEKRQECGSRMMPSGLCQPGRGTLASTFALSGKPLWDDGGGGAERGGAVGRGTP